MERSRKPIKRGANKVLAKLKRSDYFYRDFRESFRIAS